MSKIEPSPTPETIEHGDYRASHTAVAEAQAQEPRSDAVTSDWLASEAEGGAALPLTSARPKVLFYSHSGDVSGAEISLLLTLQGLQDTDGVLVAPHGELLDRARMLGIPVVGQRSHRARMSSNPIALLLGLLGTLIAGLRLRKLVRKLKPAALHANSIRAGLIGTVATFGAGIPLLWHVRDELPTNLVGRCIRFWAKRRATGVFAISNAIRDNFAPKGKLRDKTKVVYNGIDPAVKGKVADLRPLIHVKPETFVVGVVGQITPWKRQKDAISAFVKLFRQNPNCELWVVGSPKFRKENLDYEQSLHKYVRECGVDGHVRFWGFSEDVMSIMQSIDVLLVPSENEPFGRVVIEGMLAGKPVIGTSGGGIPEIIDDGNTGFLVNVGDTGAMARLLEWLARDEVLREGMGRRGRKRATEQFSIERTCAEVERTFRLLIGRKI